MHRRGEQSKIHRTEIMQMLKRKEEESKVKYTELKYYKSQYVETRKAKKTHNLNNRDVNM